MSQLLTQEKAVENWTKYQRRVSVGAYEERSAAHYETDTWPEDGIEESLFNLEHWAARQCLEFCYNHDTKAWSLEPIQEPVDLVVGMYYCIDSPDYNELGEDEPYWSGKVGSGDYDE